MRPWFLKQYFKGHHHLVGNNETFARLFGSGRRAFARARLPSSKSSLAAADGIIICQMELSIHPSIAWMKRQYFYPMFGGKIKLMELLSVRWSYHPSIHCMDEEAVLHPIFGGKRELSSIYCMDKKALS